MGRAIPGGDQVVCDECGALVENDTVALVRHVSEHSRSDPEYRDRLNADVKRLAWADPKDPPKA